MAFAESLFLATQIPLLENRFVLSYFQDSSCVEYFLDEMGTGRHVSKNLITSWDTRSEGIYVSKFYPQLFLESGSRYLSAACFYLIVRHGVELFHLQDLCTVWLETDIRVFEDFYVKLKEFEFSIASARVGDRVCLKGNFHNLPVPAREILPALNPMDWD